MTDATSLPPFAPDADDRPPRIHWGWIALLFTASFALRFTYFYLDDLTRQNPGTLVRRLLEEGTGTLAAFVLFPIIVVLERRFPMDRGRWRRAWPAHLAGFVVYSTLHTTLLAASRSVVFLALGLGQYDYGILSTRYFMESAQDLISYATLLGILVFVRVRQRLHDRELRAATLERDAARARLEALSLRLQPHFLFNALNTISSTVYDDPAAADEMIGRLGDLLRRSLQTVERQEVSVGEELETLRDYLALIDARFGDRLHWRIEADPAVHDAAVPAFLLQPLVENAVRHGAAVEYGDTDILIRIIRSDAVVEVTVDNDIGGAPADTRRVGTGLGATRDRLRLLYGPAAHLESGARDGRFRVTIRLPARTIASPPEPPEPPERPERPHAPAHAHADR